MKGDKASISFWLALMILLVTIFLFLSSYFRWVDFRFAIGPYAFNHWLGWIGAVYIAFSTPAYRLLKRRIPRRMKMLLEIHCLGNLLAFTGISVHFAHQLGRPPQFFPELGTGVVLYAAVIQNVSTGFFQKFRIGKKLGRYWRFIHVSMTMSFYLVILVHILHGLKII